MIRGLHGLFYSSDADATRAFMRDALKLPFTDVGGGWLIFDVAEGDIGVHPIDPESGKPPANTHDVSFYCDDIQGTVADLRSRGVEFKSDPVDRGYGHVTYFTMPGGIEVQLYEPRYAKAKPPAPKAKVAKAKPAPAKKPAKAAAAKKPAKPAAKGKPAASKAKPKKARR